MSYPGGDYVILSREIRNMSAKYEYLHHNPKGVDDDRSGIVAPTPEQVGGFIGADDTKWIGVPFVFELAYAGKWYVDFTSIFKALAGLNVESWTHMSTKKIKRLIKEDSIRLPIPSFKFRGGIPDMWNQLKAIEFEFLSLPGKVVTWPRLISFAIAIIVLAYLILQFGPAVIDIIQPFLPALASGLLSWYNNLKEKLWKKTVVKNQGDIETKVEYNSLLAHGIHNKLDLLKIYWPGF
jgi:hypothetical protein